jgi:hypothetical protein
VSKHRSNRKNPPRFPDARPLTEEEYKRLEQDPRFHESVRRADDDEREGRWTSMEDVVKEMAEARGRRR